MTTELHSHLLRTPALFCIYDSISPVPGFHDAEVDWNGWACPSFTLEAGKRIVAEWNGSDGTTLSYDEQRDAFVYVDPSYPDEPEIYGAETITVNGAEVKVYAIGAFGWTWDEVVRDTTVEGFYVTLDGVDVSPTTTFSALGAASAYVQAIAADQGLDPTRLDINIVGSSL